MDHHNKTGTTSLYDEAYYASHCGSIPYDRSEPHWGRFFGNIADELIRTFRPRRVFDAGCAHGFLVEAFWDRGVAAWGRDISEYAISKTRADIRQYCSLGSLAEPIEGGQFDLITCIEVLEHMTEAEGMQAIAHMTTASDRIVFSSSPDDLTEPTHINVKPAIYWMRAFAVHGFNPVIEVTIPSITPYTLAFERGAAPPDDNYLIACAKLVRARITINQDYHTKGMLSAERDRLVNQLGQIEAQRDQAIAERDLSVSQRDQTIQERDQAIAERDLSVSQRDQTIQERDLIVYQRDRAMEERALAIAQRDVAVEERDLVIAEKSQAIIERDEAIMARDEVARMAATRRDELNEVRERYEAVLASTSWKATSMLRAAAARLPWPTRRRLRQGLKLIYWTETGRFPTKLRQRVAIRKEAQRPAVLQPAGDESIDVAYYLSCYPDVAQSGAEPLRHYLTYGKAEGRHPNAREATRAAALAAGFDGDYYLRENPDVAQARVDPLDHYINYGAAEGRFPNARLAQGVLTLHDLCNPRQAEAGEKTHDEAFKISILTPVFNTNSAYLRELFQTLLNQRYGNWEWLIVDDGSSESLTICALQEIAETDPRVKISFAEANAGISAATNTALAMAEGTHVALVDHDDLLSRDALLAIYDAWKSEPYTQLFYTDECKLLPDASLEQFWAKPAWSPAYLENTMCIGHLAVYKIDFLRSLDGFRSEYDGTQDFDLALRAALAQPRVVHLPIFAYLWRAIPGSAATDLSEKHYAIERQGKAVLDYARSKHPQAAVNPGWAAGYWRIVYPLPSTPPLLSYIIPTGGGSRVIRGHRVDLILHCIRSFEAKAFYPNREFVVVHNGDLTKIQMAELAAIPQVRLVHYEAKVFNLSEKLNLGAGTARGEYLCLLNDDVEAITPKGGEEMIGYLVANPQVGGIGPLCLREDQTIQQNGVVLLPAIGPANAADGRPRTYGGHQSALRCRREVFCVGGAIFLIRKDLYLELGGYTESLPLNFNDVDFCIRLRSRGYSCVVDPYIEAYHYEGATKTGTSIVEQEKMFMLNPEVTDPYFSPWFDPGRLDYRLILERKPDRRPFAAWLDRHISKRAKLLTPEDRVKLSVCVSVYNQPKRLLEEMYQSVLMQTYRNTELVVLDNGSSSPETLQWLERLRSEERAVFIRAETNLGISGGNLKLLEVMSGDFFVAMDADDFLSVDALQMMAYAIERNPCKKVFYSDEYKSDIHSSRFLPFFKPDFDPILLTNCCYPAHLMATRRDFLQQIGSYTDARATWCHDYDTITRALAIGEEPFHVREPIYAWRINPGSTASATSSGKPEAIDSQRFVLNRLLQARGLEHQIKVEPKAIETSSGTWSLVARATVPNVSTMSYSEIVQNDAAGLQIAISTATQPGTEWLAILADPDDQETTRRLSAVALFDTRVNAVSGLLLDESRRVRWSGGVFLPGGRLFDPFSKSSFAGGGYHGLLWCQRCVDVAAPTNVLIRSSALARAARSGAGSLNALMIALGLDAHRRGEFIAITPHCVSIVSNASSIPLDRAGDAIGKPELEAGSRWYDGRLETDRPYMMRGIA